METEENKKTKSEMKKLGEKLPWNRSNDENKKNVREDKTAHLKSTRRLFLTRSRVSDKVSMSIEKAETQGEVN